MKESEMINEKTWDTSLDPYHSDTFQLRDEGYEEQWLFVDVESNPRAKLFVKLCSKEYLKKFT